MTTANEPKPSAFVPFDQEEKEQMEAVEESDLRGIPDARKKLAELKEAVLNTFAKKRQINIRLSEHVLKELQIKAMEEGIPYQTLISSILHKYVSGKIN